MGKFQPPYRLINKAASWVRIRKAAFHSTLSQEQAMHFALAPSITIARDPGSGGRPIAELVAKKLKYTMYDEELIDSISKSTNKRKEVIKRVDEKARTQMEDFIQSIINPDYVSETTYLTHLSRSILAVGHQGKAVILGRGANFILPSQDSLNVLITAPYHVRVARAIQYENVSQEKARDIIAKVSEERQKFVAEYFRKDHSNPKYYDLIINTEYFSLEEAAEVIATAFAKKFS